MPKNTEQKQIFSEIEYLETHRDKNLFIYNNIDLWPLVKFTVWCEFIHFQSNQNQQKISFMKHILINFIKPALILLRFIKLAFAKIGSQYNAEYISPNDSEIIFISRTNYLQVIEDGRLFDRIVDVLISQLSCSQKWTKYYFQSRSKIHSLYFSGRFFRNVPAQNLKVSSNLIQKMSTFAGDNGINAQSFVNHFSDNLKEFISWKHFGSNLFGQSTNLKTIYIGCWYSPAAMGLIAAARERGITVVDVQHGKQGRYHPMYIGWNYIPQPDGYAMVPNWFWCWGEPSRERILRSSPERKIHRSFVGGYPWISYYKEKIRANYNVLHYRNFNNCILLTLQPKISLNPEPIPNFIIDFLREENSESHIIIRRHPNSIGDIEYIKNRLKNIKKEFYDVDDGKINLLDYFTQITHHITAFSSCCYEASAFGVPTLLFGAAAIEDYAEEIKSGQFSWACGEKFDLSSWIKENKSCNRSQSFIETSVRKAAFIVQNHNFADVE